MKIKTSTTRSGDFRVTATQGDVVCTATMPKSRDAFGIALRSCYAIVDLLEQLERDRSGCPNCD